jgi:hypothetical protein
MYLQSLIVYNMFALAILSSALRIQFRRCWLTTTIFLHRDMLIDVVRFYELYVSVSWSTVRGSFEKMKHHNESLWNVVPHFGR